MFGLDQILGGQGDGAVDQISQQVGAEPSLVNTAIQMALPAILGGLARNASTSQGAESLNNALEQDHAGGGILDSLGGLGGLGGLAGTVLGGSNPPSRQADAGGILGHIFGNNQGNVTQQISDRSGLGMGQVAQILMMLAPLVMGYLGRQKQQENVSADGLGGLLGGLLGGAQQAAPQADQGFLSSILDRDGDGSSMDDIASMALRNMMGGR